MTKQFVERGIQFTPRMWAELAIIAEQRGLTVPQLLLMVVNGVTRGMVNLDRIERCLEEEGWWAPRRRPRGRY